MPEKVVLSKRLFCWKDRFSRKHVSSERSFYKKARDRLTFVTPFSFLGKKVENFQINLLSDIIREDERKFLDLIIFICVSRSIASFLVLSSSYVFYLWWWS